MKTNKLARRIAAFTIPVALTACGGGGDSPVTPPPAAASLSISGTAATGAAIANATVRVKCAAGSASTTTIADGSFNVTLSGGSLPCVLSVTSGAIDLYSVSESGQAGSVRANITPLSQLVAAQIAGGNPSTLFNNFDTSAQTKLTASAVSSAIAAVTAALQGTVDLTGVNPLKDPLVAANGSSTGNALDQKLDALAAALAKAGVTLGEVSAALVASGATPAPVQTLLQPVAASCAGLRTGRYRALNPNTPDPRWANHVLQLDAGTLKASFWDGTSSTLVGQGGCSFTINDATSTTLLLLSKSGVAIGRNTPTAAPTQTEVGVIIPEQAIALSDLAGTWNSVGYARSAAGAPLHPTAATYTLDAAGKFTAGADCSGLSACTAWTAMPGDIKASTGGGFEFTDAAGAVQRLFAFKSADGQLTLYRLRPNLAGFSVAARQQALSLPTVGAVSSVWDFSINSSGYASALTDTVTTVKSIDATAHSFTRERPSDGRIDGFTINTPRDGLRYRAAGSSPTNTGVTVTFSEIISMPLPGTGVGVYTSVAANQNFFGVSVNKP